MFFLHCRLSKEKEELTVWDQNKHPQHGKTLKKRFKDENRGKKI